jgi:hypothetical protein
MDFKPLFRGSERLELIYKKGGKKGAGQVNISQFTGNLKKRR